MNTEETFGQLVEKKDNNLEKANKPSLLSRLYSKYIKGFDDDLLLFTKKLSALTNDGMALLPALKTLSVQIDNVVLKKIITDSIPEIESGTPFHTCLRRHNNIFNDIYCDLIKIGEESGRIDRVLPRLSYLLESSNEIENKVKEAWFFPTRYCIIAVFEIIFLIGYIIPLFKILYSNFYKPKLTLKVFEFALLIQNNVIYILSALLIFFILYYLISLTKFGKLIKDYIKVKLPIFGELFRKITMILYSRNLVTLFNSGITIITSMKICNENVQNLYLKRKLEQVVTNIENGSPIKEAFEKENFMPKKSINIIETGEEFGFIDEMFTEIANNNEKESFISSKQIMTLAKPVYVTIMSIICGILVIAMFMPIYYALLKFFLYK